MLVYRSKQVDIEGHDVVKNGYHHILIQRARGVLGRERLLGGFVHSLQELIVLLHHGPENFAGFFSVLSLIGT